MLHAPTDSSNSENLAARVYEPFDGGRTAKSDRNLQRPLCHRTAGKHARFDTDRQWPGNFTSWSDKPSLLFASIGLPRRLDQSGFA